MMAVTISLLLLRALVAAVFLSSGISHLQQPESRGNSIGLSPMATKVLGTVEVVGAAMLLLGILLPLAAFALSMVMLGAIYKKVVEWKTGFWGEKSSGWYYDLLYLTCLVVLASLDRVGLAAG